MRYIINGASGVLGFALIKKLLEGGDDVSILARSESSLSHIFNEFGRDSFYSVHIIDLKDYASAQSEISGDVFIHLAWAGVEKEARDNVALQMKNVGYTLDAIKLAKKVGCKVFVGAGSQAEFADSNTPMGNHTPTIPNTAYGAAKLAAGQMGRLLAESVELKFYWIRIFSLFGPYDRRYSFMSIMIEKFLKNESLEMTTGEQIWDYLFSYDAANIILTCLSSNTINQYFSIGSGNRIKLMDYVSMTCKIIDSSSKISNNYLNKDNSKRKYLVADTSSIKSINYEFKYTFEQGILETIYFIRKSMNSYE